ncbi:MAG TPA: ferrochelatase [Candidatus Limnocylindria bacterium]|nr:ferrochelatase [Candidatus Limnocylindria bacterium]
MSSPYQAILLVAFGGPTAPDEIRPFLARVTKGIPIPPERLEEVAHHYEAVGGRSPLHEITFRQAAALQRLLTEQGNPLPVYVGMRNSTPFFRESLEHMQNAGIKTALGFILSSHRTEASWERYQINIADARTELGDSAPAIDFCEGWHEHPLFIQSWMELIQTAYTEVAPERRDSTPLIFTAHSLPTPMAARSPYVEQLKTSARMIADKLGHRHWSLAYQSRSGKPADPWLEPDIGDALRKLAAEGHHEVVVAPIGFVCDHVEVLYDLDIEARKIAGDLKLNMVRASCPNDHPMFIRMIADVILRKMHNPEAGI